MKARCTNCEATMDNRDFDQPNCPLTVSPAEGESWAEYKSRSNKWRECVREIAKEEGRTMIDVALEMRPSLRDLNALEGA